MRLLCSKVLQICSLQLDMDVSDSFNEQSGELSFGRIVVPLVLEPSYCSYNHSMIYNQLTTFMFKSWNLTNSASNSVSLVLKFLKGPYIYMSSLVGMHQIWYQYNIGWKFNTYSFQSYWKFCLIHLLCLEFFIICSVVFFSFWNTSIWYCRLGSLSYTNSMINWIVCSSANGCTNCSWNVKFFISPIYKKIICRKSEDDNSSNSTTRSFVLKQCFT